MSSNVVGLFDERWIENVFNEAGLQVDISTKGNVRFISESGDVAVLSMEQMVRLGEVLTVAFNRDDGEEPDDGNGDQPA